MVGYIYKYENTINHKVYIGQTVHLPERQQEHKYKAAYLKTKFYNAVRKYGWENFKFEVVEQIETEDDAELIELLDSLEIQYIQQHDSYHKGYNSTLGGSGGFGKIMPDSFIDYCKHRTYSEETRKKMSESAKRRCEKVEEIERLRKLGQNMNKKRPPYKQSETRNAAIRKAKAKPIVQLDEFGNILNEFTVAKDAAKFIVENYANDKSIVGIENGLRRHCKGKIKKRLYYGFEWKFKTNV